MFRDKNNRQKGFTLVELAIAMGIIGLLLGGVLQGNKMIENARIKALYKECTSYSSAICSYIDTYDGDIPGDENDPDYPPGDTQWGNNDGKVSESEGKKLIADLVLAGLITQRPLSDGWPASVYIHNGGVIKIFSRTLSWRGYADDDPVRIWFEFTRIPLTAIAELDRKYDDGIWNSGRIATVNSYTSRTDGNLCSMYYKF